MMLTFFIRWSRVNTTQLCLCFLMTTGSLVFVSLVLAAQATQLQPLTLQSNRKIELGQMLFFDRRLSGDGTMSCAICHIPDQAFSDGRDISGAYPTNKHWRNTPSLLNTAYLQSFFWDGRSDSLEHQALGPIESPFEMNSNLAFISAKLVEIPEYRAAFQSAFSAEVNPELILTALAAFEQTLTVTDSPYDRYLAGENHALNDMAQTGMKIFFGPGGCSRCHAGPLLSDQKFYNLGVPDTDLLRQDPQHRSTRRYQLASQGMPMQESDPGRYRIDKNAAMMGAFRTPPLRQVAQTGPYMHNGSLKTLTEVVAFFNQGGGEDVYKTPLLRKQNFNSKEQAALVAFLESLSGTVPLITRPHLPGD